MDEFEFIEYIRKQIKIFTPAVLGVGDDCAVLEGLTGDKELLISCDLLTEGVHFEIEWATPEQLGKKSVAVCLSDVAAMGGKPLALVSAVSIPPQKTEILSDLFEGIKKECQQYQVNLVGGDTSKAKDFLTICNTVIGEVSKSQFICRKGAREGDYIYCTDFIGDRGLGLEILLKKSRIENLGKTDRRMLIQKYVQPIPRIDTGLKLRELKGITAMIDISDGLLQDLNHILQSSQVSGIPLAISFSN